VTVEDITKMQPSIYQPLPPSSFEQTSNNIPKRSPETENHKQPIPITLINKSKSLITQMKKKERPLSTPRLPWKSHLI